MRTKIRWRGTFIAAVSVVGFFAVYYYDYLEGNQSAKIWLWLFALGGFFGGALSFIDSCRQLMGTPNNDERRSG